MTHPLRPPLWLRSIRQRPHTVILLCLLSATAVITSMLGPVLVRAVHQSTLTDALDAAELAGTSVSIFGDVAAGTPYDVIRGPAAAGLEAGTTGAAAGLWEQPEVVITSRTVVVWKARADAVGRNALVNAFGDDCDAYVVTAGACPTAAGQVMISNVDAERDKVAVGAPITFSLAQAPLTRVKVVGTYDPVRSVRAGLVRPSTTQGVLAGVETDPVVMSTLQSAELPLPVTVTTRMSIRPDLSIDDVAAVQASIEEIKVAVNAQDRLLELRTELPDLLERVDDQGRSAQVLIMVTAVQALFLAIFALAVVLQRVGRARAAEWSVGRLRGVPRGRWLRSVYTEPVVGLLIGLPLGFAAGTVLARLGVATVLRPGTPVEVWRWPVIIAAAAATVIALGALVAVSLGSIRRPLAELVQQEVESRRMTVLGAVAHTAVFLLAAATLFQLVTGGQLVGLQLGLIAPALFALAVAMLAVRVAVLTVRRVTTRPPRGLAALVVGRHVARAPSALNPAMIIAVGVALAVFASQIFVLSSRNQGLRADAIVGAGTVLAVTVPEGTDLLTAVRTADPDGRQAMAVKDTAVGDFSSDARIVAVDSTRLEAVSTWSPSWSGVADLAARLRGPVGPAITLRGRSVELALSGVQVQPQPLPDPTAQGAVDPAPPPTVVLTVETAGRWQRVALGRLATGTRPQSQRLTAELPCMEGCRLVSVGLSAVKNQPYKASFTVTEVSTDTQPAAEAATWLRDGSRWRAQTVNETVADPSAAATPQPTPDGLGIEAYDLAGGATAAVSPNDTVDPLPAVLAPGTSVEDVPGVVGAGYGTGLDGQQQMLTVLGQASVLPRSLDDGVLVDLSNAQGLSDPANSLTVDQVWLAPDVGPEVEQALAELGIRVQSRQLLVDTRDDLEQQATTSGAAVAGVVSAAALLLTLLALVAARWSDAGRRGGDWRTLREGGVSRRRIRSLIRVEVAVPAVLGVIAGALSGAVAARIAAARLPLVDLAAAGPPLDLRLSWWPILLLAVGTAVVIMIISQCAALAETRSERSR